MELPTIKSCQVIIEFEDGSTYDFDTIVRAITYNDRGQWNSVDLVRAGPIVEEDYKQ